MIRVALPIRTRSEANAHEHWRLRQKRAKNQRLTTAAGLLMHRAPPIGTGLVVTLTRVAPMKLDSDNLAGSGKHVRDEIARWLGIDDRDERVEWRYAQRKGRVREYAVEVTVEVVS